MSETPRWHSASWWGAVGAVMAGIGVVVALFAWLVPKSAAPTAPRVSSADTAVTSTGSEPSKARPESSPTASAATSVEPCSHMEVEDDAINTYYVDLDTCVTDTKPFLAADVSVNLQRFFFGPGNREMNPIVRVRIVKDDQVSVQGCTRGRAVADVVFVFQDVKVDETMCVYTSEKRWVGLKFPADFTEPIPFDIVQLS